MQRNRTDPIDKKLLAIYLKWSRSIERGESTLRNRDLLSEWSDGSLIEAIKYGRIYRLETLLKKVNDIIMGPIRRELVLIRIFERRNLQVCLKIQSLQHRVKLEIQSGIIPLIYPVILKINKKSSNKVTHRKLNLKQPVCQAYLGIHS